MFDAILRYRFTRFIQQRPILEPLMQVDVAEVNRDQFKVGASAKKFRHNGLVFDRVNAAGRIHHGASWHEEWSTACCNFHLHFEHLPPFLWRPVPPYVAVFSGCGRACARHISNHNIESRGRQASKVSSIVLGHHDVGQSQPTSVADEHVQSTRDRFVGDDHAFGMKQFSQLGRFWSGRCTHVKSQYRPFGIKDSNREHACGFLPGDPAGLVKQSHHSLSDSFGRLSASERHHESTLIWHPRDRLGSKRFHLLNGPLTVGTVQADTECFWEGSKSGFEPFFRRSSQRFNQPGECWLFSESATFRINVRWPPHVSWSSSASLGLPPRWKDGSCCSVPCWARVHRGTSPQSSFPCSFGPSPCKSPRPFPLGHGYAGCTTQHRLCWSV